MYLKAEYITQVKYRRTPMNNEVIVTARKLTDYEERLMFMPKFFGQYWLLWKTTLITGCVN